MSSNPNEDFESTILDIEEGALAFSAEAAPLTTASLIEDEADIPIFSDVVSSNPNHDDRTDAESSPAAGPTTTAPDPHPEHAVDDVSEALSTLYSGDDSPSFVTWMDAAMERGRNDNVLAPDADERAPNSDEWGEGGNDDATHLTAEVVVDPTIVINDATLIVDADDDEGEVIIGTTILPWWKQHNGRVVLGTVLVLLAAFGTTIGVSSRNAASNGDVGDPPSGEGVAVATASNDTANFTTFSGMFNGIEAYDVIVPVKGSHGTCPSDDSAKDCGATLEIWMDIAGWSIMNLAVVTENFALPPNRTERLMDTLSGPVNMADHYGCRISGWLVPPITSDEYVLVVLSGENNSELWLSADDDPINKVKVAQFSNSYVGFQRNEQYSSQTSFVAGRSYYFEVRVEDYESIYNICMIFLLARVLLYKYTSPSYRHVFIIFDFRLLGFGCRGH